MGEVYVAEHVGIQTRVAIKVLLPEISSDRDHVQRLFNEARLASKIKHAGITRIFDVGFHEGRAYLVMELLEGESLARRIQRGSLGEAEIIEIGRQTANVLAATHAANITHRDLKPDNIFLTPDAELACNERVKILDFGIAKLPGSGGPRTIGTMGTPDYMAPEQWGDSARVDWRADAYSLGCVLFEMCAGRPPFITTTIADAYMQHTQSMAPSPRACGAAISGELDALIASLLAKDPALRGASMFEVASRLAAIGSKRTRGPSDSRSPVGRPPSLRTPTTLGGSVGELAVVDPPRRRALASVVVAAALASVIAVGVLATRSRTREVSAATPTAPAQRMVPVATPEPTPAPAATVPPTAASAPTPAPPPPTTSTTATASPAPPPPAAKASTARTQPPRSTAPPPAPRSKAARPKATPAPTPPVRPAQAGDELEGRT